MRYLEYNESALLQADQVGILIPNERFDEVKYKCAGINACWLYLNDRIRTEKTNESCYFGNKGGQVYPTFKRYNDNFVQYLGKLYEDTTIRLIDEDWDKKGVFDAVAKEIEKRYKCRCTAENVTIKSIYHPDLTFDFMVNVYLPSRIYYPECYVQFEIHANGKKIIITIREMATKTGAMISDISEDNCGKFGKLRNELSAHAEELLKIGFADFEVNSTLAKLIELQNICEEIKINDKIIDSLTQAEKETNKYQELSYKI